jgi:ATP-dependent helicase HrpB
VNVPKHNDLPIQAVLADVVTALTERSTVVLVAPPGAGKTTMVPIAICESGIVERQKIVMLQPRRVAARLSANRIADLMGSRVGKKVGYRIRHEHRVGPETRIEVVTEGLLTRILQNDPFLEGIGCVILDEFHERSVHADLCLSLLQDVRREARPDLKLVVMSATLDAERVASYLDDAPVVRSDGRLFPVDVRYEARLDSRPLHKRCADGVRRAVREHEEGHILVFLPGVREIERTRRELSGLTGVQVLPLHGRLSSAEQDRAVQPGRDRTVILSTNVAETSLTIPGVRVVVDSGLARGLRFDARIGMDRLVLGPISRASADQRAGRSGRLEKGVCYRLWTESDHGARSDFGKPEIQRVDPSSVLLEVAAWGADPGTFPWFEEPPRVHVDRAVSLLEDLGALHEGRITELGRDLVALPLSPRQGALVLKGKSMGETWLAATIATLLAERNPVRGKEGGDELSTRMELWAAFDAGESWAREGGHKQVLRSLTQVRTQILRLLGEERAMGSRNSAPGLVEELLMAVFPDRVGRQRSAGTPRYTMVGGTGASLLDREHPRPAPWIIGLHLQALDQKDHSDLQIRLWHPIDPTSLPVTCQVETRFDPEHQRVTRREVDRFRDLTVATRQVTTKADPQEVEEALARAATAQPERAFDLSRDERELVARFSFLSATFSDEAFHDLGVLERGGVAATEVDPLIRFLCSGQRSFSDLGKLPIMGLVRSFLGEKIWQFMERSAPARLKLPGGDTVRIIYEIGQVPRIEARVQQLFGLRNTPTVASGRVRLMVHMLAPSRRPVQITQDMENFWETSYQSVRKDLRGRYPKHAWPEVPTVADARRRPGKKRRS